MRLDAGTHTVAIDVMGGDFGPAVVAEGALRASQQFQIPIALVGPVAELTPLVSVSRAVARLIDSQEAVSMDETAGRSVRSKQNSSIRLAFREVQAGHAHAVVSCGNTGAIMAAGMLESGACDGISRPAIASAIPRRHGGAPVVLLDSGANVECSALQLIEFACMGAAYAQVAFSVPQPKVALLSNGAEASKGTSVLRKAAELLRSQPSLNFVGFIEGHQLADGAVDVVVCDGYVGNVALKCMEGTVQLVRDWLQQAANSTILSKLGFGMARSSLEALFSSSLSSTAHGGAPLLGLRDICVVCHGAADSASVASAVRLAHTLATQDLNSALHQVLSGLRQHAVAKRKGFWRKMLRRKPGTAPA